ncbi:DUF2971 domain-containing protein [Streptococcus mitis]|uniref:F0F1 ATP synthase subunit delta n=1 Tax=Streptococcus mitis TaxID=28037 RepID=A0A7X1V2A4_STRMT|nr:DUF2971 domain-containing protein [Streptococcus mitis]MQQ31437.1 hypothetical protein [Streptococcus mitis]MQQ49572.1 hypothetical protein [Streptococcus mitis]
MDEQKYNLEESLAELDKLFYLSTKETDKTACEALAEKARIIYEQYPEAEEIALRYARILFNLSVEQVNVEEIGKTVNSVKQIFEQFEQSEDIALQYAMVLVNLSVEQVNVEGRGNTANSVKQIFKQFKQSESIALQYAMALVNLSAEQVNIEEIGDTVSSVKQIFEQFKQSEDISLRYATVLYNLSNRQNDIKERKESISEIEALTLKFQNSEEIALRYAMALVNLSAKQINVEELNKTIHSVQQIFEQFNQSEDIALQYAMALVNLSAEQVNVEELDKTIHSVQQIFEQFNQSEKIALRYAMALFNLSNRQNDIKERKESISEIEALTLKFQNSEEIALQYAMALVNLSAKQINVEELNKTIHSAQQIFEQFNQSEDIALQYAMALVNLSLEQTNLDKLNDTVSKLKKIALNFEKNEDITLYYAEALAKIITKQQNEEEKLEIIDKLKRLHDRFVQSEEITVQYLTARMDLVKNNQIDQSNLLNDIYQSLESIPSIKILNMFIGILENEEQFKQDQVQISTTNIVKALDKLCFDSSIEEGKDEKEKNLLIRTLKLGIISDTKYDILKNWIEHYGKDSKKINKLIKIYTLVQQIKYELGLKAEDKNRKLKFGHYTSGEALQSILGKEDKAPFSISGKTRLNNANYMNDPEEGVILEEILKLEKRNPLEPSSWFLMSFTSKTDDLAMWSQYGNNAEGVCIVLNENDFARYHSLSDLPWYQKNSDKQIGHKMKSSVEIQNDNSLNESDKEKSTRGNESVQNYEDKHSTLNNDTDYLYRVAYVHYSNDQFDIEESELFTNEEVTRLKGLLEDLKSELRDYKNSEDSFYKKAIADCIEEIRYLFKSVDYKYEEELRILQYANLIPDNNKIKIDYSPEFGKLYLERKEKIQIDEVIFGPKFPNPEYVTPLLKLLDKEINYKKSTIKFR